MAIRKDVQENWMVESGIFVVCPLEYLAEKLGLAEDHITAALGEIHGLITMEPYTKIKVNKSYGVTKEGDVLNEIEVKSIKYIMSDKDVEIVRHMQEGELRHDEYFESQKSRIDKVGFEGSDSLKEKISICSRTNEEYKQLIIGKTIRSQS